MKTFLLFAVLISILSILINAQVNSNIDFFKQGVNNAGTDFWISAPPAFDETGSTSHFIKLFIISPYKQEIFVDSNDGLKRNKTVKANVVMEINLTPPEAQPITLNYPITEVIPSKVFEGKGIHVYGQKPFVLYVVSKYSGIAGGYLAIPTKSLGQQYVVTSYGSFPWSNSKFPAMVTVVGTQDNTTVTVKVGGNSISSITTDKGEKLIEDEFYYKINKGDILLLSNPKDLQIIAGTKIRASKPVAVQSAMYCAQIPIGNTTCDYTVEMELPVETWGKYYHIPLTIDRTNSNILRIFAKYDSTVVFRDGKEVILLPYGIFGFDNYSGRENSSWQEVRVWPIGVKPPKIATYHGNRPIYVTLYNQSSSEDSDQYLDEDRKPFSMIISPVEQYQNSLALCSPGVNGGNPFAKNYLSIIYETDENGEMPDSLLFGETKEGQIEWLPLKIKDTQIDSTYFSDFEDDNFKNRIFKFKRIDLPPVGMYYLRSPKKLTAYSVGSGYYESYGFPSGLGLFDLISYDSLAPIITWNPDSKGVINNAVIYEQPPLTDTSYFSGLSFFDILESESVNYALSNYEIGEINNDGKILSGNFDAAPIDPDKFGKLSIYAIDKTGNDTTFIFEYLPEDPNSIKNNEAKFVSNSKVIPSPVVDESSVLDFNLIQSGKVTIRICDLVGNCLFILNDEYLNNGSHKFNIPTNKLVAGVYVYEIIYQNEIISDKFEVVK